MTVYDFTFSGSFAGAAVSVKNTATDTVVDTDTLGSASGGVVVHSVDLAEGAYNAKATAAGAGLVAEAVGIANIEDTLANAPGASETAYFTGTGPVYATDGGGSAGTINFVADDRQGDLPAWVSLSAGDIVLGDDAGTCAFAFNGLFDFDFSATTPQDSGGELQNAFTFLIDGDTFSHSNATKPGDGEDEQTSTADVFGGVAVGSSITCEAYPFATDVTDGVATPRVALTITRLAPAPELP